VCRGTTLRCQAKGPCLRRDKQVPNELTVSAILKRGVKPPILKLAASGGVTSYTRLTRFNAEFSTLPSGSVSAHGKPRHRHNTVWITGKLLRYGADATAHELF
jgi:hypothetical protein